MRIDIITVFPEMFRGFLGESILSRAVRAGKVLFRVVDLRDFARDLRRTVDDRPYSGGPGMLMKPEVWFDAVESLRTPEARVVLTTPAGEPYVQRKAEEFAACEHLMFLCGHYEGIDARVREIVTDEVSIGDFVMTGGEIAAAAMVDSVVRLLPGVLGGGAAATANESFGRDGLLEAPQYTRPPVFRGMSVPEVLLGGDHAKVENWRRGESIDLTSRRRPELVK
ncbi:MAG: tRNA (guanosine(37)-N1)-methyltransferase TrmD [Kiritimatiellae bacterium]|jgi:tRNA (guanine37-N1)-methyltransferase|nr:tRNA (guanosine(37)-N1)-methyltransferase TrmD [Kiritimatiellia bacterium]